MGSSRQSANNSEKLVQFRLGDAKRISAAVTAYERSPRGVVTSTLPRAAGASSASARTATFSGVWGVGQSKTVSFSTWTDTAIAANHLFPVGAVAGVSKCVVFRSGEDYILVNAQCC